MVGKAKEALIATATVLAVIYLLNKVSFTRGIVQTAING